MVDKSVLTEKGGARTADGVDWCYDGTRYIKDSRLGASAWFSPFGSPWLLVLHSGSDGHSCVTDAEARAGTLLYNEWQTGQYNCH